VSSGGEGLGARRAPVLAAWSHLEAVLPQLFDRSIEVGDDHCRVAVRRDGGRLVSFQVDLSALAFEADEDLGEGGRRLDLPKAEQGPKLD